MYYLALSVSCSVLVSVLLKLARRHDIDVRQAVAVNYAVAAGLCLALLQPSLDTLQRPATPWGVLIALGLLLPSVFLAMAASVRHAGIVRSDAAQRLSLFIPLLAAFLFFGQPLTGKVGAGIAVAFAALACLIGRPQQGPQAGDEGRGRWAWPLAVWLGYGVIDVLFKQLSKAGTQFAGGLLAAFVLAGIVITVTLLAMRVRWTWRNAGAGVLLGLANFGNILFYIRAHQQYADDPAVVFAAMNIGVITLGTLVGAFAFHEKLSARNWVGVGLAVAAVLVLIG
jgi:drug/metabolite transporter (DMT)-like permease